MERLSLIHPIYLDVPMLVSFAAAIQGGLSFTSDVVSEAKDSQSSTEKIAAKMGVSNLFTSLFSLSASAEHANSSGEDNRETRQESRKHSEASIAIILYDQLQKHSGYLVRPKNVADLQGMEPGSLVEISGTLEKNAVDAMIDHIDAISILSKLSLANMAKTNQKGKTKSQQGNSTPIEHMGAVLDADRKRTPISNVLVRCTQPEDAKVIVSLRTENLRDLTLSELDRNTVRVVGKVTRALAAGERMSTFENYGLSLLKTSKLEEMFSKVTNVGDLNLRFSDVEIEGPAVQLLPLMVFV